MVANQENTVRVLSVPATHPYTRAVQPDQVSYLPDPDIDGNWWPHPALEAGYWADPARASEVDVMHVHFGFEHRTPAQIEELVRALPVPLVVTVHDLDNPHLTDPAEQAAHHDRVRTLVGAAAAVITLTDCAAERLRREFGAEHLHVLPHPSVAPAPGVAAHGGGAGVFLKSLRPNVVSDPAFYLGIAQRVPLTVYIHDVPATRALRAALEGSDNLELIVHDPLADAPLHAAVAGLDTCLLPYTRGTHSGWLEMCRDHGTNVAVPDTGCYASQADTPEAVEIYRAGDAASAAEALRALIARGPVPYSGDRAAQAERVEAAHAEIYRGVVR
ncbi:glycosyltransferase [Corynebacterium sp. UBA2622]|uniref:glycosyltransferase n=1 Tax=Corynebacterium sp. UBA2622 TaxID=1946393 RepID=UPI0025B9C450|nr:glycosyltransferase [Corynebacterium sp. UBA2622]